MGLNTAMSEVSFHQIDVDDEEITVLVEPKPAEQAAWLLRRRSTRCFRGGSRDREQIGIGESQ